MGDELAITNIGYETLLTEQTDEFDRLRDVQKKYGNMFLFGEPTTMMMILLLKLYHECIARVSLCKGGYEHELGTFQDFCAKSKLRAMTGIMQLSNGDLYMTISEDPKEDGEYFNKRKLVLSILENAGIRVKYPEYEGNTSGEKSNADLFKIKTGNTVFNPETLKWRERYLTDSNFFKKDDPAIEHMFASIAQGKSTYDYDEQIRRFALNVNWVDSWEYLATRRINGLSFAPFKRKSKVNENPHLFEITCNNGSTCTEAKLFGYFKEKLSQIEGLSIASFVAYWIGNDYPPNHHLSSYCFTPVGVKDGSPQNTTRLKHLRERCQKVIRANPLFDYLKSKYGKYEEILKNIVQPMALACPGCLANAKKYMEGEYKQWNYKTCKKKRTIKVTAGGSRKRNNKRKTRRNNRK